MKFCLIALGLGLLSLAACNGDSKETDEDTNVDDTDTSVDTDTEDTDTEDTELEEGVIIQETVGSAGATLEASSDAGIVTIEIPPGALTEDVDIQVQETAMGDLVAAESFADISGTAWVFTPHGTTFDEGVVVTFSQNGTGDTVCMLNDQADSIWKMVSDANFSPNTVSFMTNTFSVYVPVSTCETYCSTIAEPVCSGEGLDHPTCMSTCQTFNLSNPIDSCEDAVITNYRCFLNGTLTADDFDCATGEPMLRTCTETQTAAQECSSQGGCTDLTGTWYVRTASNGVTHTTYNSAQQEIELVVEGTIGIATHSELSEELQAELGAADYPTLFAINFETTDVYGQALPDGNYPVLYFGLDAAGAFKLGFVNEDQQLRVTTDHTNSCNPKFQELEFVFTEGSETSSVIFSKNIFDGDGDGIGAVGGDCDDNDASIYPGAIEIPSDGIDQNCDGVVD